MDRALIAAGSNPFPTSDPRGAAIGEPKVCAGRLIPGPDDRLTATGAGAALTGRLRSRLIRR